jgi:hypothetical protein
MINIWGGKALGGQTGSISEGEVQAFPKSSVLVTAPYIPLFNSASHVNSKLGLEIYFRSK